jgi:hypothetical protein
VLLDEKKNLLLSNFADFTIFSQGRNESKRSWPTLLSKSYYSINLEVFYPSNDNLIDGYQTETLVEIGFGRLLLGT